MIVALASLHFQSQMLIVITLKSFFLLSNVCYQVWKTTRLPHNVGRSIS